MNRRSKNDSNMDEHTHQTESLPRKMSLAEARKFLGVSPTKMTALVHNGEISVESDPLDRRVKLVKRSDLEKLKQRRFRS
jgi:hypothetical protein